MKPLCTVRMGNCRDRPRRRNPSAGPRLYSQLHYFAQHGSFTLILIYLLVALKIISPEEWRFLCTWGNSLTCLTLFLALLHRSGPHSSPRRQQSPLLLTTASCWPGHPPPHHVQKPQREGNWDQAGGAKSAANLESLDVGSSLRSCG